MDRNSKLSPHFTLGELIHSETAERKGIDNMPPPEIISKLIYLCDEVLEPVRAHFKQAFRPNSGYRGEELNKEVGGSSRSQHCLGEAVDIEIAGVSNYDLALWISENIKYDQLILECYRPGVPSSGWVHVSLKAREQENRFAVLTYSNRSYQNGLVA